MFPYGAIIASQLLHKQTPYVPKPPKISTLGEYKQTSPEDFYNLLVNRGKIAGVMEMCDIISNWQGFDNLSPKQKFHFVTETETPEYYSIANRVKRFLTKF